MIIDRGTLECIVYIVHLFALLLLSFRSSSKLKQTSTTPKLSGGNILDHFSVPCHALYRTCVSTVVLCCHPIYSGRQTCGRASRGHTGGRSHMISPLSFCDACLFFIARRIPSSTEGFNNLGGRGYDDFVPGEVIKTAPSGDETT